MLKNPDINQANIKICSRCIYDERVPSINFDSQGICNYCRRIESLVDQYGTGKDKGENEFRKIIKRIKEHGKRNKYDCVIGVSGGIDSSYLIYLAVKWGLRPLAVHYDNTWNSAIASMNIQKLLSKLDIDLYTHVVNNKESDDIFRSFFLAGVPEIEAPTDLAYAYVLRIAAAKYKVKFIIEGHSFLEEGITPLGKNYFDGKYIREIHRNFGRHNIKTYPLMTFNRFLKSVLIDNPKFIRPFWYINYDKEKARSFLNKNFGFLYYGGHHLENRMSAFLHSIYLPQKFNTDFRNNTLSASVRNGKISREEAWKLYNKEPFIEKGLEDYFKKRMDLNNQQYNLLINAPGKYWYEYPTYKKRFERFRFLFYLLAKNENVTMSFYLKYCFPIVHD